MDFQDANLQGANFRYADVRAHGRITRREAADLCRIGPYQGTRMLQKLVEQGELASHGERKGTYYALRSNI
jgi:hypothetical protein